MAMFLARIKRALNLGKKSITANGTYTASSDGYDGYSSVEVNVSGGTLTDLTPSNASPATITSGNDYHATAGGYAIESYNNVTPSNSSPVALTSGDIDKMGGNGYAIQSYSSKTPSSTPVSVTGDDIVKMGGRGYLISTYTSAAPSDIDPPSVSLGEIIKITGNSGYLYKTQQSGGDLYSLVSAATISNGGTGSSTQSFPATSGKHYLVFAYRAAANTTPNGVSISSGATVEKTFVDNVQNSQTGARVKTWIAIVKATSSTVTLAGSGNGCFYMPLD